MFRLVAGLFLALSVGWKIALGLTNNQGKQDDFKPVLIDFLARQHFAVSDANDFGGVEAIAGDCRLRIIWTEIRAWKQDTIKDIASADDRVFFVYRQVIYPDLPTWSIVANQYWSNFLRKIELKHPIESPILAVIAPARCNAEQLPWHELMTSA
jgi:hypothetical protein